MAMRGNQHNSNTLVYILLVLVVGGLSWWSYSQLEYELVEVDKGYQGEARSNDFLAAEYFLKRMGQSAEKIVLFSNRQTELKANDTLLVPGNRLAFDKRRSAKLIEWIEQGGHLIITGNPSRPEDYASHDNILDSLGLFLEWKIGEEESIDEDEPFYLDIDEEDFWLVDFVDYQVISYTDSFDQQIIWTIENNNKLHAIQLQIAQGKLTLMSDMKMFRNNYIDSYDHAAFLLSLSSRHIDSSDEGIFYYSLYDDRMSLIAWLFENAGPLVISFLLAVIIILWNMVPRFGPLINVHKPISRHFMDHLVASGNYHWRQGHYSRLLSEVRKQLSLQSQKLYPEWTNLSKKDQMTHFSEISGIQSSAIESALFDTNVERVDDFVNKIKILEKLRKSL